MDLKVPIETTRWDAADYLETPRDIAGYLREAFADGDPGLIAAALGDVARSKGMAEVAKDAGLSRESLYKALSNTGNPELSTVLKVLDVLGLQLLPKPKAKSTVRPANRRRLKRKPAVAKTKKVA